MTKVIDAATGHRREAPPVPQGAVEFEREGFCGGRQIVRDGEIAGVPMRWVHWKGTGTLSHFIAYEWHTPEAKKGQRRAEIQPYLRPMKEIRL